MPAASSDERRLLALLWVTTFVVMMDGRMIVTVLPDVARDLGESVPATGLILTAYLVPYGVFSLVYGQLADRIGPLRVVAGASVAFAAVTAVAVVAPDLPTLALARLATGAIAAAFFPLALMTVGALVPYARRQHVIATLTGAVATGTIAGAALGGLLAEVASWRLMPALAALLMAALIVPLRRVRSAVAPTAHPGGLAAQRALLRDRRALAFYGVVGIEGALAFAGQGFLGALLHERDGLPYGEIGVILGLEAVVTLIVSRQMGRLRRMVSEDAAIVLGLGGLALSFGALLLVHGRLAVLPLALMGGAFVLCHTTFQTRATEIAPDRRGAGVSLFVLALFLGSGGGTALLAALLGAAGYTAVLVTCGAGLGALALVAPPLTRLRAAPVAGADRGTR